MIYKTRSFVATNWNLNSSEVFERNKQQIKFLAYGEETCPTTNKLHHQVYLYFHNPRSSGPRSLHKIGKMFGEIHCHVEPMRGSFMQNESYCSKEGAFIKCGEEPKQGMRGDLLETSKLLLDGKITVDCVLLEDPLTYHMYGRTLTQLGVLAMRKKWRTTMTIGKWYWGNTGVGKSHKIFENYNPNTHYVKDLSVKWWDGYKQQDIVIFNEFRGQVTFSDLLTLVDKWPHNVPVRGHESVPFISKFLLISSSCHPKDIYINILTNNERIDQLERRFKIKQLINIFPLP